ncbi:AMP-binding protein [Myroides sp. M-43]|uniref:class I adenylate-forming enzyme family protein n=1 Tax=Myroides oncorhynchi TaxID=2893756 RepID=UPI001E2EC576|nr:AMP-binding protein [Myroides oncorhynchi]MCC9044545.1 AMP-binding protein [Myroides oncorhynchi]
MNLLKILKVNVDKFPTKPFLIYQNNKYTYEEAYKIIKQVSSLFDNLGLKKGDTVAAMCFNTPAFVFSMFAAWDLGLIFVPINHKLKSKALEFVLKDSNTKLLLFDNQLAETVQAVNHTCIKLTTQGNTQPFDCFETLYQKHNFSLYSYDLQDNDIAQILYTSGTTGMPKGCVMKHSSITFAALIAALGLSFVPTDILLMAMPIWHSSPLNNWFGATLVVGGTTVLQREYHPQELLENIQKEKVTAYFGAPISLIMPTKLPNFAEYNLTSIRAWIYGGGPISPTTAKELMTLYKNTNFYQVFGMTETGPLGMTLYPYEQLTKAGSLGKNSMPGVEMKLINELGNVATKGEIAEIYFRTDSLMSEYLNKEEETKEVFTLDGFYKTGDLVRIDDDGYIFVVDRRKEMIITGGENVFSKEIEDCILECTAVSEVAVIGLPHEEWGETVTAFIILKQGQTLSADELKAYITSKLAKYKVPKKYFFVEDFPRTPTGKTQKFLLKQQYENINN